MLWQLCCHGMCKIVAWLDEALIFFVVSLKNCWTNLGVVGDWDNMMLMWCHCNDLVLVEWFVMTIHVILTFCLWEMLIGVCLQIPHRMAVNISHISLILFYFQTMKKRRLKVRRKIQDVCQELEALYNVQIHTHANRKRQYRISWHDGIPPLICLSKCRVTGLGLRHVLNSLAPGRCSCKLIVVQWNLSVTTTFIIKFITCDLFRNVF